MRDKGELRAVGDGEKMYEDDKETSNEEDEAEEQEEGHQRSRTVASPELSSRRDVEDRSLTHIPFRSWCNH